MTRFARNSAISALGLCCLVLATARGLAPSGAPTPTPAREVTTRDNDKTVTVRVGDRLLANFGDADTPLLVSVDDPAILRPIAPDGARVTYEARQPGQTRITVNGACRKGAFWQQERRLSLARPYIVMVVVAP